MLAIIGASGRSGVALGRALYARGVAFRAVVRNVARWRAHGIPACVRAAELADGPALRQALEGASVIISCAHARHAPAVLGAAPRDARFVFLGSTRRYSAWADAHGDGVRAGEAAFLAAGRPGVMLHPTMIYGATGEDNVQRLATLLSRLRLAPLPDGGRALVQPIHQDDLTRCLLAAINQGWTAPEVLVVAGPKPVPYRDFILAVAAAAGLPAPPVVTLPPRLLLAAAPLTAILPFVPRIRLAEVRRLLEDKAFDVTPMRDRLGVVGMPLEEGLARTFRPVPRDPPWMLAPWRGWTQTTGLRAEVPHADRQPHR